MIYILCCMCTIYNIYNILIYLLCILYNIYIYIYIYMYMYTILHYIHYIFLQDRLEERISRVNFCLIQRAALAYYKI